MGPNQKTPEKKLYVQDNEGVWHEVKYDREKILEAVKDAYSDDMYDRFEAWLNDPDDDSDFDADIVLDNDILAEIISPEDPVQDLS